MATKTKATKAAAIPLQASTGSPVPIKDITRDETLQIRFHMDAKTVSQYAEAMKSGQLEQFPPVRLGKIGNALLLIDGWHRVEAASIAGERTINALITPMTREEAVWEAAQANTKHGLPLKAREYREVFRAFIKAKKYRIGHNWLSYRDIAKIIGKSRGSIQNWMEKDYPRLAKQYSKESEKREDVEPPDFHEQQAMENSRQAKRAIEDARNLARNMNPEDLGDLILKLEETLDELRQQPHEAPESSDF